MISILTGKNKKEVMMNTVEPIRDINKINKIKGDLLKQKNPRDLLLFVLGINTGLRISDILPLKLDDVKDKKGDPKDYIYLTEQKTKRQRKIVLNKEVKKALQIYFNKSKIYDLDSYLFTSEKDERNRPLTKTMAWHLVNKWCRQVGIIERVGTHTLRKTLGYQMRKKGIAIEVIQRILGHASVKTTTLYIGIDQAELEEVVNGFCL
ncbi:Tyrosine recombinase XerC [subsurface metagenome]